MKKTPEQRKAELLEKKKKIEAQIRMISARETAKNRKEDTRRKIIAGAVLLTQIEKEPKVKQWFVEKLGDAVEDRDRHLFIELLGKNAND